MVRNVVFDMGNVILDYNPDKIIQNYTDDLELHQFIKERVFESEEWQKLDQGLMTIEQAKTIMMEKLSPEQAKLVEDVMNSWYKYMEPNEDMLKLVQELKEKGLSIYLLSNASLEFYNYYYNVPTLKYFNGFYISAKHKMVKPDPMIYQSFFDAFQLNPAECFFIDDRLENVEGAISAKMNSVVFDGNITKLRYELSRWNIL